MNEPRDLEQLRADLDARQRNTQWEDARKGGKSIDSFLWHGDPNAKPVQRAGLVVFAIAFLMFAVAFASIPFQKDFEDGWPFEFLLALCYLLISLRLLRNTCLRGQRAIPDHVRKRQNDEESAE